MTTRLVTLSILLGVPLSVVSAQKVAQAPRQPCLDAHFPTEQLSSGATDIETPDLNGDGLLDAAIVTASGLEIWIRESRGSWSIREYVAAGVYPFSLTSGDLDGDGSIDLVAADSTRTNVLVFRNTGTGSFLPPEIHAAGSSVERPVAVDLDADGDLDVVAQPPLSGSSTGILLNSGNGALSLASSLLTGEYAGVGDIDGDGDPDLVGASTASGLLTVWRNNGLAAFSLHSSLPLTQTGPLVVSDFDGDGVGDLAVRTSTGVDVFLNLGGPSFGSPTSYPISGTRFGLLAADIDGDGDSDLAISDYALLEILRNDGGVFTPSGPRGLGSGLRELCFADHDGDGDLDLATGASALIENLGGLEFDKGMLLDVGSSIGTAVVVGNVDADSLKDVVVVSSGTLSIFTQNPPGAFTKSTLAIPGCRAVALGDMDGDHDQDLVVVAGELLLLRNQGSGVFDAPVTLDPGLFLRIALADFENDGDLDIAVTDSIAGSIFLFRNQGNGTLEPALERHVGAAEEIAVGNLNGDGRPDIVVNFFNGVSVVFSTGTVGYKQPVNLFPDPSIGPGIRSVTVGDLNQDALGDLAMANQDGRALVMYNRGNEQFGQTIEYGPRSPVGSPNDIDIADVDNDGLKDMVLIDRNSSFVVLQNQGRRNFMKRPYLVDCDLRAVLCADLDADGLVDLVGTGRYFFSFDGVLSVLRRECR